jgi:hypothetical protein
VAQSQPAARHGLESRPESLECRVDSQDVAEAYAVLKQGDSVLVLGEAGSGIGDIPRAIYELCCGEFDVAIATYKGSAKQFYLEIAKALDTPYELPVYDKEGELKGAKPMTVDQLKEEILDNVGDLTLLILPEAKRLTTAVRYWLEDVRAAGAKLCACAPVNPMRDIFLEMIEVELTLPDDSVIRTAMVNEAKALGYELGRSQLAELQTLAGRNPMLARKVVRRAKLGISQTPEHTQYVVMMPVIIAMLFAFAVVRFVGMGTNNKTLYIIGGICMIAAMALKQLGYVRGSRKRLGQ